MNQQTLNELIEDGQPVTITTGLMIAARERAHREHSEALRAGALCIRCRVKKAAKSHKLNTRALRHQHTTAN